MRPVSKTILRRYRQYRQRMARYDSEQVNLDKFARVCRLRNKITQKKFRDKHEYKNAYFCWIGQREDREGVTFDDFVLFAKVAIRDEYGRIMPHDPLNRKLSMTILGTL